MRPFFLFPLFLVGCFDKSDSGDNGDTWVRATIDGQGYEGNSQGVVWYRSATMLQLFPGDVLEGTVSGWAEGDTGSWDTAFDAEADAGTWLQYMPEGVTWVSASGTFTVDNWEAHTPENSYDPILGYITGTFEGSLTCYMGCDGAAATVEITGGDYRSMVSDVEGD